MNVELCDLYCLALNLCNSKEAQISLRDLDGLVFLPQQANLRNNLFCNLNSFVIDTNYVTKTDLTFSNLNNFAFLAYKCTDSNLSLTKLNCLIEESN